MRPVPFDRWDRRAGLGASELPALTGSLPWGSAASVWLDKMDLGSPRESEAMRAGRDLETTVLRMAARKLDRRLVGNLLTFPHPDWPAVRLFATPDGFATPRSALVEIKVVGHRFGDWRDGPPEYVRVQVQGQLACLPRVDRAIVAALIGGDVKTWTVERDPAVQETLPRLVADWWARYVLGDQAPDPSDDGDAWAILRATAQVRPDRVERIATPDEQRAGTTLRTLLADRVALDERIDALRLALANAASETDVLGLGWRATWGPRTTVDWHALVTDQRIAPDVVDRFRRQSSAFTFRQDRGGSND